MTMNIDQAEKTEGGKLIEAFITATAETMGIEIESITWARDIIETDECHIVTIKASTEETTCVELSSEAIADYLSKIVSSTLWNIPTYGLM